MRALLDTNVILDLLLDREPWVEQAAPLWRAVEQGRLLAHVSASAVADVYYVARRVVGRDRARAAVILCLERLQVCPVDRALLEWALTLAGTDFEDDLQTAAAEVTRLDAIVTRDPQGFAAATVPVWSPAECCARLREP